MRFNVLIFSSILALMSCGMPNEQVFMSDLNAQQSAVDRELNLKGQFVCVCGIGGESSGYGLRLFDGNIIEVVFAREDLRSFFVEGQKVSVQGHYEQVEGIEIPVRNVFVIEAVALIK